MNSSNIISDDKDKEIELLKLRLQITEQELKECKEFFGYDDDMTLEDMKNYKSECEQEEKELRKMDDWHSHTHEKHRDLKDPYRASELHGVVGKEIKEEITREQHENEQQLLDEKKKRKSKSPNKNLNKGGLDQSKQESKTTQSGQ